MSRFLRRHLIKLLLAGALLALLLIALRPAPLLIDSETVTIGAMARTIEEVGRTRAVASYLLSAPLAAEARRIILNPGDRVEAGETVAVLDALAVPVLDAREMAAARARVEGATAALAATEKEREALQAGAILAAEELRRSRKLAAAGLISASELGVALAEAERSAAHERAAANRVRVARHELEAARTALSYAGEHHTANGRLELRSPISGVVLRRHFESARVVAPGEPIIEIADPASLEIEVDLLSADAVRLEPGMRVLLERWGADDHLEGRVRLVEPGGVTRVSALGVEEQRVLVIVDLVSPREQWQRLGDAYRVNARFILWEADEVIRVPVGALFRRRPNGQDEPGWTVFVLENGRARLRPVEIGERGGRYAQVLTGLAPDEAVIVHPPRDLAPGDRVRRRGG